MTLVPSIPLNNGLEIPQLGFGVFQIPPDKTEAAVLEAIEVGYRHIDTAQMYGNEQAVGSAVRASGLDRGEIFVTSKLRNNAHERAAALAAFDETLAALDLEYLDLFLIHWPLPAHGDFLETWQAMEEMLATGKVHAIGVSNFNPHHIERLLDHADTVPAVNQVELHPYLTQEDVRAFDRKTGIATEAWSPIAQGKVLGEHVIRDIAQRLGRSPAQVTLRWHLQRGEIVFPKAASRPHLEENFDLFDFELSDSDISAITGLNRNERIGWDPDDFKGRID
jgi:2,5-diketo-D-gluconate reductase A